MASDPTSEYPSSKRVFGGVSRSPNYPQLNFPQALDRVSKIYEKEHTHIIPAEAAAEALGYTSLNGTSKSVLSALRKYGLLSSSGDGYKVSEDAMTMIELPADDSQRIEAIRRSALSPSAFKLLHSKYGENLPSDGTLRHFLVQNNYQSDAANQVIKFYKETISYLSRLGDIPDKREGTATNLPSSSVNRIGSVSPTGSTVLAQPTPQIATVGNLRFHIAQDCDAEIAFTGAVTQSAIDRLIKYLELSKDLYAEFEQTAKIARPVARSVTRETKTENEDQFDAEGDENMDR